MYYLNVEKFNLLIYRRGKLINCEKIDEYESFSIVSTYIKPLLEIKFKNGPSYLFIPSILDYLYHYLKNLKLSYPEYLEQELKKHLESLKEIENG